MTVRKSLEREEEYRVRDTDGPVTEAGRRLLAAFDGDGSVPRRNVLLALINSVAAIEAEARQQAATELREINDRLAGVEATNRLLARAAEARQQGREGIADSGVFNTTTAGALEAERQSELLGSALAFLRQFVSQDDNALTPGWYERQGRIVEATRRFLDACRALGAAPESNS